MPTFTELSKDDMSFTRGRATTGEHLQAMKIGSLQRIADALEAQNKPKSFVDDMKIAVLTDRLDKMEKFLDGMGLLLDQAVADDKGIVKEVNARLDALEGKQDDARPTASVREGDDFSTIREVNHERD